MVSAARGDTVGIIGAGMFGTALAHALAERGRAVVTGSQNSDVVNQMRSARRNPRLPGVELSAAMAVTGEAAELVERARFFIFAVSSVDVRQRARLLGRIVDGSAIAVHAVGGLIEP